MIDRAFLRSNPDIIRHGAARKGIDAPVDDVLRYDEERRRILTELETHQAEMNRLSKSIGQFMAQGQREEAEKAKAGASELKEKIAAGEAQQRLTEDRLAFAEARIPNPPHESVHDGKTEADNKVMRVWGEKPTLETKPHWETAEALNLLDFGRASKISGSGFALYTGMGARLQRALFNFMIDHQTQRNGYQEIYPPVIVNSASLFGTGQLPKFEEDLFQVDEGLYLIPTAEVPVTNIFRDEILDNSALPMKMAAFSSCFRREAGAAGKDTRGIQRMHQFDKVEMVKLARPEESYDELEALTQDAESVLQVLGLHYRVVLQCSGEMGFTQAKTYDIEVWAPGVDKYLEISSCTNFEAFQARRANIRFRRAQGEKPEFVHTLNGSGLACPRLFAALLETYLQPDGSVLLPEILRPYVGTDKL